MTAPKLPLLPADTTQLTFRDLRAYGLACYRQGLEDAAKVCDDEARIREEAGQKHPEESDSRGRCFAAARAASNCAKGIRTEIT